MVKKSRHFLRLFLIFLIAWNPYLTTLIKVCSILTYKVRFFIFFAKIAHILEKRDVVFSI